MKNSFASRKALYYPTTESMHRSLQRKLSHIKTASVPVSYNYCSARFMFLIQRPTSVRLSTRFRGLFVFENDVLYRSTQRTCLIATLTWTKIGKWWRSIAIFWNRDWLATAPHPCWLWFRQKEDMVLLFTSSAIVCNITRYRKNFDTVNIYLKDDWSE